ncbi:hypothetical protein J2Z33_003011 [Rubellimicrobium aerolatum]|nr:hypothetical protein [Rubellimicrobium aerolatum]
MAWASGLMLLLALAGPGRAEDFTFRRVGVPAPGATQRITVQIDPNAPRLVSNRASPSPEPGPAPVAGGGPGPEAGWFWGAVSPRLADGGLGRLDDALRVLARAPAEGVGGPRAETLRRIAEDHGPAILRETAGTRVPPALALAVIAVESAGQVEAVSRAGAAGLMQLMPATAARFGVEDRLHAAQSIHGGVAYLDWLLGRFGGDPILALAAYNAGEGAVEDSGGVPDYAETRAYVPKVLAAWSLAAALCRTPPDPAAKGCMALADAL